MRFFGSSHASCLLLTRLKARARKGVESGRLGALRVPLRLGPRQPNIAKSDWFAAETYTRTRTAPVLVYTLYAAILCSAASQSRSPGNFPIGPF